MATWNQLKSYNHYNQIRVVVRQQGELFCALTFQESEWLALRDVDTDGLDVLEEYKESLNRRHFLLYFVS